MNSKEKLNFRICAMVNSVTGRTQQLGNWIINLSIPNSFYALIFDTLL